MTLKVLIAFLYFVREIIAPDHGALQALRGMEVEIIASGAGVKFRLL